MHYRTAGLTELDGVHRAVLELVESQQAFGSQIDPCASATALREHLSRLIVDGLVDVAIADDVLIGVVTVSTVDDALARTERVGVIEYLYVDPSYRGRGVGTELLTRGESRLREHGVDRIELEVLSLNTDAMQFYQARGYQVRRHRLGKRADAGDDIAGHHSE